MDRRVPVAFLLLALQACGGSSEIDAEPGPVPGEFPIHAVQGRDTISPMTGTVVSLRGIVTGDFQSADGNRDDLGGFYMQQEIPDTDAATSEGIFVADSGAERVDVNVGDRVTVRGLVAEVGGETQILAEQVLPDGRGHIDATVVELPFAVSIRNAAGNAVPDLERLEGMLVRLPQQLAVTELYDLERYGELVLSAGGRLRAFTNGNRPDAAGYARSREQDRLRSVILDDGRLELFAVPARYLAPTDLPDRPVRVGDAVRGLVGVLRYGRPAQDSGAEGWRLVPVDDPEFLDRNPRPAMLPAVTGIIRVMSYNAGNFFTSLDSGKDVCGPARDSACRGARSAREFDRQLAKTVSLIRESGAHVVGLSEIENNGPVAPLSLVAALNDASDGARWSQVETGVIGSDAIRVAIIYDSEAVITVGPPAVLDSSVNARYRDRRNRPAVAQAFADRRGNGRFTVVASHLKSKSSSCENDGDPDMRDGQAHCNRTRTAAAEVQAEWLATDPTGSGDPDVLVMGDLNANLREDPLLAFEAAGYANLLLEEVGLEAYSYVFRGQAGALDHALASVSLRPQVRQVFEWHVNADESAALDYRLPPGRDPARFDASRPWRASDHDPLIIDLALD